MSQNLYFAYGSNLNLSDLNAWLERNGYSPDLLEFHSPACLPDFEPAFTYRSASRGGGVLSIRERTGSIVEGVLFKVREGGWEALDSKEGAPRCYKRQTVTVLKPNGAAIQAVTYRVTPRNESRFVAPTDDYVSVVRAGMKRWGISQQALTASSRDRRSLAECLACQLPFSFMDRQVATDSLLPLKDAILNGRLSERRLAKVSGCWTANPANL